MDIVVERLVECKLCLLPKPLNRYTRPPKRDRSRRCLDCYCIHKRQQYLLDPGLREEQNRKTKEWYTLNRSKILQDRRADSRRVILKAQGLTLNQFAERLAKQNGGCAICSRTDSGRNYGSGQLLVDHDHKCCKKRSCGRCVRGLLCVKCNAAIGFMNDDPEVVLKAYQYLKGAA